MSTRLEIALLRIVAVVATAGSWFHNLRFALDGGDLASFFEAALSTKASRSIALDLWAMCFLLCAWLLREGRRVGVRRPWLYVLGGLSIAMAGAFPLFLVARRRALAAGTPTAVSAPTFGRFAGALAGLAFMIVGALRVHALLSADSASALVASFGPSDPACSWLWDLGGILASVWLLAIAELRGPAAASARRALFLSLFGASVAFPLLAARVEQTDPLRNEPATSPNANRT